MGLEGTMTCEVCKRPTPVADMKFMPKGTGRMALCKDCIARTSGKSNAPVKEIRISEKSRFDMPSQPKAKIGSGAAYFCRKCNYSFRSSSQTPVCGYCGKADSISPR